MKTRLQVQKDKMEKEQMNKKNGQSMRSLNDFPDEILCHILSFLPTTKLSIRTSVLSKRWRYMWTSLEELYLFRQFTILLSPQISLSNLKKLMLHEVPFTNYHELNILFAASALKELELALCEWKMDTPGELIISAPKLETLIIYEELDFHHSSVEARLALSSILVFSPIRYFDYSGAVIRDFRFSCSSSIATAKILCIASYAYIEGIHLHHFHEVLRSLRFVKNLELPVHAAQATNFATLPIFENVTTLQLTEDGVEFNCKEIEMFLNKCPCLEALILPEGIFDEEGEDEDEDDYDINQLCPNFLRLSSLKSIEIGCFDGCMKELSFMQIFLEKATFLETMDIKLSEVGKSKKEEIRSFLDTILGGRNLELELLD